MRAVLLKSPNIAKAEIITLSEPKIGKGEVLLRVEAASLNYLDIAVSKGDFGASQFPLIPVADGAGEIIDKADDVEDFNIGDRVVPHFMPDWQYGPIHPKRIERLRGVSMTGSLVEYIAVPANSLVKIPSIFNYQEAATLPIAATTAWNAICEANVRPGSIVVLQGTGGVSMYALAFAKAAGAKVIILSSSDEKLERAKKLGADELINYRETPAWGERINNLTNGVGADLIIEGGGSETFSQSINAAKFEGTIFVIGFLSGFKVSIDVLPIFYKKLRIIGNNTGSRSDLEDAVRAIDTNGIKPIIDRTFDFEDYREAYQVLGNGKHFGKLVIKVA